MYLKDITPVGDLIHTAIQRYCDARRDIGDAGSELQLGIYVGAEAALAALISGSPDVNLDALVGNCRGSVCRLDENGNPLIKD